MKNITPATPPQSRQNFGINGDMTEDKGERNGREKLEREMGNKSALNAIKYVVEQEFNARKKLFLSKVLFTSLEKQFYSTRWLPQLFK